MREGRGGRGGICGFLLAEEPSCWRRDHSGEVTPGGEGGEDGGERDHVLYPAD